MDFRKIVTIIFLLFGTIEIKAQLNADFSIEAEYCLQENIIPQNLSINASQYNWYFCPSTVGNGSEVIENSTSLSTSRSFATAIVGDTNMVLLYASGSLRKASYNDYDFSGTPTVTAITGSSGSFSAQSDFAVIKDVGQWYGFTPNNSASVGLSRSFFGTQIGSALESYDFIEGIAPVYNTQSIEIINEDGVKYIVAGKSSGGELVFVNFANGFGQAATSTYSYSVSGASAIHGITHRKTNTGWELIIITGTNNQVYTVSLDENLLNPGSASFTATGYTPNSPAEIELAYDNGVESLILLNGDGDISVIEYLNGSWTFKRTIETTAVGFSTLNATTVSDTTVLIGSSVSGAYSGLNRIYFGTSCSASILTSEQQNPEVFYTSSSVPDITLIAYDVNGKSDRNTKSLTVTSSTASNISFTIDESRCIDNINTFTSIDEGDIVSYSWDFNGDNVEDSNLANPTYDYITDGTGMYTITLSAENNDGCTNTTVQEISIYNAPSAPDFDYSATTLCSNSDITFSNLTSENGSGAVITYLWDFNGEDTSNEKDPAYAFASAGTKTVTLTAMIPGCTTTVYSEDIEIIDGPSVDFSYTNNCFGEAIQFIEAASGTDITGYSWDFGDSNSSTDPDPAHTYTTTGDYEISLTVTNLSGCETTGSQTISVTNDPKSGFNYGTATENLPVSFSGEDLTPADDGVTVWSWDFGGLGSSDQQSTDFTFGTPGDYNVSLMVETSQGCGDSISQTVSVSESTQPTADFLLPASICSDENIVIQNTSVNASAYSWYFCPSTVGNGNEIIENTTSTTGTQSFATAIVGDTSVVAFYSSGSLRKASYNDYDFSGTPTVTAITGSSGSFSAQSDFAVIKDGGQWYGFTPNNSASVSLSRSFFGTQIGSALESYDFIEGIAPVYNTQSIEIINEDGVKYIVAGKSSGGELVFVNFANGFGQAATSTYSYSVSGASAIHGITHRKTNTGWELIIITGTNNQVYTVSLDENLLNPGSASFTATGYTPNSPAEIELAYDNGVESLILLNGDGDISVIEYLNGSWTFKRTIETTAVGFSTLNATTVSDTTVLIGSSVSGAYSGLNRIYFGTSCSASILTSEQQNPEVFYTSSSVPDITMIAYDVNGKSDRNTQSLTVTSSTASNISFTIDESRCIDNINTFSSIDDGDIVSYSWDFDGDGLEDSTDPNPTYQFTEAGMYEVRLTVESDEGCGNFTQESITIYPEPPVPVFTVPKDSFCVGESVIVSNLTDDAAWDDLVEYVWSITDLTDTTTAAPEFTFTQPGEKIVRVISQIPGCESLEVTDTIQVIESPIVDFAADPVCDGEVTVFISMINEGTILWDFGDGNSSTEENPTHSYATPDTYSVSLSATNDLECTTTVIKEVAVNAIPQANFQYDLVCAGSESIFEDMSVVDQADISSWQWFVDGEFESDEQFPVITFPDAGDYTVRLVAGSSKGCESFYEEVVTVGAAPAAGIGIELGCLGEPTMFSDLTDPSEVLTRSWMIDGQPYTEEQPSVIFSESGEYEVELTVTNNQLCSSIITETFTVHDLPVLGFNISGQCNNELILLEDASTSASDPIASRQWYIDDNLIGTGATIAISGYLPGTYGFALEVTTENGCVVTTEQTYEIVETPVASFTASNDYGVPPFQLDFSNTSQMATVNEWYVNDALITTNPSPSIIFNDSGSQQVRLITYNATGCADTAELVVNAIEPVVDLALSEIQLVEDGNSYEIVLDVKNSSNLPIEALDVNVELQNQFSVSEQIYQRINAGEESIVILGTSIPKSSSAPAYLCISISSAYEEATASLIDNEACITIEPKISFEPPYPNPATTETSLRYILPEGGNASIEVYDVAGNLEILKDYEDLPTGLNQFILNVTNLDAGTYLVKFRYKESVIVSKIIKL